VLSGRLELRTSCDSRSHALSGNWSKMDRSGTPLVVSGSALVADFAVTGLHFEDMVTCGIEPLQWLMGSISLFCG
jgi:hypothetical protein